MYFHIQHECTYKLKILSSSYKSMWYGTHFTSLQGVKNEHLVKTSDEANFNQMFSVFDCFLWTMTEGHPSFWLILIDTAVQLVAGVSQLISHYLMSCFSFSLTTAKCQGSPIFVMALINEVIKEGLMRKPVQVTARGITFDESAAANAEMECRK